MAVNRRIAASAVAAVVAFGSFAAVPPVPVSAAAAKPNIVIIITDDQRTDTLNTTFMPKVSTLLSDASRTTTFGNAFVPNALCCPSRVSILTGVHSHTSGVYGNIAPYGGYAGFDDSVSIATALTPDYDTLFVGKYLNGYPDSTWDYVPPGWDRWFSIKTGSYYNYYATDNGTRTARYAALPGDYSGRVLAHKAIEYVTDAVTAGAPFLLYYAPAAPHGSRPGSSIDEAYPHAPAPDPRDVDRFAGLPPYRPATYGEGDDVSDMPRYIQDSPWSATITAATDRLRQRQLESIYSADREIGKLVASLPADTLVLFMSDNGYLWGEHRWRSKLVPYEESIGVPMFVRWPLGTDVSGVHPDMLALNVDLVPTILDIAGYPADTPTASSHYGGTNEHVPPEGLSLYSGTPRQSFPLEHWNETGRVPGYCGLRTADGYMYARYWDRDYPDNGFVELYDVDADPLEEHNVANDPAFASVLTTLTQQTRARCSPVPPTYSWTG